jgi:hypothetical protein
MDIIIHKHNHLGQETFRYPAYLLARAENAITVEAIFHREPMELGYVSLTPGDRFVEHFYSDRWYNVFAIYSAGDGALKGWYCNVTRPAIIGDGDVRADDLALDYFVQPSGKEFILDEEEFAALPLAEEERAQARAALAELRTLAAQRAGPFALSPTE